MQPTHLNEVSHGLIRNLEEAIKQAVAKHSYNMTDSSLTTALSYAVHVLVECYGNNVSASSASYWLLFLQSFGARDFLYTQWASSLDRNSDIAVSLNKLNCLANGSYPNTQSIGNASCVAGCTNNNPFDDFFHLSPNLSDSTLRQIGVEATFLSANSAAWNRLDISKVDIKATLSNPIVSGVHLEPKDKHSHSANVVMCLQLCPKQKTLFLSVGIPAIKSEEGAESVGAVPGPWFVDKVGSYNYG